MAKTATDTTLEAAARLRMAIVRTARRLRQEAALGAGADLTPTSASALATVERHGPLTPSELADIERVRRPTATRTLRVLLEAGLVDRTPDPADGRSSLVSINADGRERLRRLRGRKNAYLARRMRDLPDSDLQTLERAAEILEGILEEPRRAGADEPRRGSKEPRRRANPGDTP
jgi:DNA-binding MarR family transcriptional regulator